MNFIKKIFENKVDDLVHKNFKRFSKGIYENRALVEIDNGKKAIKVKTSFEFAEDFARFLGNTIKNKVKISGGIITIKDIRSELNFEIIMPSTIIWNTELITNSTITTSLEYFVGITSPNRLE